MRIPLSILGCAMLAMTALAQYPVDYTVYFWPDPAYPPEKEIVNGQRIERRYAIMYNVGQGPGTDSYNFLLRVYGPNNTQIVCEAPTVVQPWIGRDTMRKIAFFEAVYPMKAVTKSRVPTGKYGLIDFITERVQPGGTTQDNPNGNTWPPYVNGAPSGLVPFQVNEGAEQVKCGLVPQLPILRLPAGFKIPH